jgi:trehalose synthase
VTLKDVGIARLDPGRFQAVLDSEDCRRLLGRLAQAAERLAGRRLWQVNSTGQGGGVAEMLAPALKQQGATVIWSCHLGIDQPNDLARTAWEFLRPAVLEADAYVFSRAAYCWEGLDRARLAVIAPCIDAFAPKNQTLEPATVNAILHTAGILEDPAAEMGTPGFRRLDGSPGRVVRRAEMIQDQPIPPSAPLVVQVSRWDPLKDPLGVLQGFARHVPQALGAHLVLAGPAAASVSDDPEGDQVLQQVRRAGAALPRAARDRIHLACLPMEDLEENGAMVNAIQRRADVIVQKSLVEGFGLTVAEAMWKARPVLASRVGGIQDQIRHGHSGLLLEDPSDLVGFGRAVQALLTDPDRAQRMGEAAHRRVCSDYLAPSADPGPGPHRPGGGLSETFGGERRTGLNRRWAGQ